MRVDDGFGRLWDNADEEDGALAAAVLGGDLTWLEAGVLDGSEGTGPWITAWQAGASETVNLARRYDSPS